MRRLATRIVSSRLTGSAYRRRPSLSVLGHVTLTRSASEAVGCVSRLVSIRPTCGLGSYGHQTVANCPRKPRSGERGYGLGECLPRLRFGLVSILAAIGLCAVVPAGCASFQVPKIDPSGERLFVVGDDISDPTAANSNFSDYPGKIRSANTSAVVLFPRATVAPVGSEMVMLAAVRGSDGYLRTNERVEWMLSPTGVGEFVEVDKGSWTDPLVFDYTWARKIDNNFAVNSTSRRLLRMTRGTSRLDDDVHVLRGQAWVTVTSPVEGTSSVTAYAPNVHGWESRQDSARIHWVDAQWSFPAPTISSAGSTRVLTTTVARHTDQSARSGWLVRYEILDGPAAGFSPSGTQVAEVPTDDSGAASVEIFQKQPTAGTNRIAIRVICPAGFCVSELREPLTVGSGCSLVTWSSADVAVRISGPAVGSIGHTLKYRIEVSNSGDLAADDVVVTGVVPGGMSFVSANPPAEQTGSTIRWPVGSLGMGQTRTFEAEYRAQREGTAEVCAEASAAGGFSASKCVVTAVEAPKLEVEIRGPERANVGDEVTYELVVTNRGQVAATDLVILDSFDPGLEHAIEPGNLIKKEFGRLEAGESRSIGVVFKVVQVGRLCHEVEVRGPGGVSASARACVEATAATRTAVPDSPPPPPPVTADTAPRDRPGPAPVTDPSALSVEIVAPRTCVIGDKPKFQILVTNKGNQTLTEVNVSCLLDPKLYVLEASAGYEWRQSDGAILFKLPPMPPGGVSLLSEVLCECVAEADRARLSVEVTCREGVRKNEETSVEIRSDTPTPPNGLKINIDAPRGPIGPDQDLTCQIRVANNGLVADRNVVVEVIVPEEMVIDRLRTRGPALYAIEQQRISFYPVDELGLNEELEYRIGLRTRASGDVVLQATVTSYNLSAPLVVEEKMTINVPE